MLWWTWSVGLSLQMFFIVRKQVFFFSCKFMVDIYITCATTQQVSNTVKPENMSAKGKPSTSDLYVESDVLLICSYNHCRFLRPRPLLKGWPLFVGGLYIRFDCSYILSSYRSFWSYYRCKEFIKKIISYFLRFVWETSDYNTCV